MCPSRLCVVFERAICIGVGNGLLHGLIGAQAAVHSRAVRACCLTPLPHPRCDGELADPIYRYMHEYGWSGLLVEPLPDLFERLQHTYRAVQGRIRFANVAVTDPEQKCEMIRVPPALVDSGEAPDWALGVSSFFDSRSAVGGVGASKQDFATYVEKLERTSVSCITLPALLARYDVAYIDWFQVLASLGRLHVCLCGDWRHGDARASD